MAIAHAQIGDTSHLDAVFSHNLLEFGQLFLFLLAAMTYINTMDERGIFNLIRVNLLSSNLSLREIYWTTGLLAFSISPVADNLTTAERRIHAANGLSRQYTRAQSELA